MVRKILSVVIPRFPDGTPISKIIRRQTDYRALTSDTPADFLDEVMGGVKMLCGNGADSVLNGITGMLNTFLKSAIGCGMGSETYRQYYSVYASGPCIYRIDFGVWSQNVTSKSFLAVVKDVVSVVGYKSIVDINKISFYDFLCLTYETLSSEGWKKEDMIEVINSCKDVYELVKGEDLSRYNTMINSIEESSTASLNFERKFMSNFI